jgi:hypothetical protein
MTTDWTAARILAYLAAFLARSPAILTSFNHNLQHTLFPAIPVEEEKKSPNISPDPRSKPPTSRNMIFHAHP